MHDETVQVRKVAAPDKLKTERFLSPRLVGHQNKLTRAQLNLIVCLRFVRSLQPLYPIGNHSKVHLLTTSLSIIIQFYCSMLSSPRFFETHALWESFFFYLLFSSVPGAVHHVTWWGRCFLRIISTPILSNTTLMHPNSYDFLLAIKIHHTCPRPGVGTIAS